MHPCFSIRTHTSNDYVIAQPCLPDVPRSPFFVLHHSSQSHYSGALSAARHNSVLMDNPIVSMDSTHCTYDTSSLQHGNVQVRSRGSHSSSFVQIRDKQPIKRSPKRLDQRQHETSRKRHPGYSIIRNAPQPVLTQPATHASRTSCRTDTQCTAVFVT